MEDRIQVLQIALENWGLDLAPELHEQIEWFYLNPKEIEEDVIRKMLKRRKTFDVVLCSDYIDNCLLKKISKVIETYGLIVDIEFKGEISENFKKQKQPIFMDTSEKNWVTKEICDNFFSGQMGTKFHVNTIAIDSKFKGKKKIFGENYLRLEGNFFGFDSLSLLTWQYNIAFYQKSKKIWLEFEHSEDVKLSMTILGFESGGSNVKKIWHYSEEEFKKGLEFDYDTGIGSLSISISASGVGWFQVGPLHYRDSRHKYGEYILGGKKVSDKKNQELYYYFNPGDLKPPLNVYFSGYRSAEGFEGFFMMKSLGAPFLLVTDPRLEGGAFYMGSLELENQLTMVIKNCLTQLNFSNKELILSGLSMGTYGALYYSSFLKPDSIIIGKPLVNVGTIAKNEKIIRPGGFPTSLDILNLLTGTLSETGIEKLNERFWSSFKTGDFSKTQFIISYMRDDDYDKNAYTDIVDYFIDEETIVMGKGISGRHNDNSQAINQWFINQYKRVLREKFGREMLDGF